MKPRNWGVWFVSMFLVGAGADAAFPVASGLKQWLNCSTMLIPIEMYGDSLPFAQDSYPPDVRVLFNLGYTDAGGRHFYFEPPDSPQRVDLQRNFMFFDFLSDMIEPVGVTKKNVDPPPLLDFLKLRFEQEWRARNADLLFSVGLGVMRGPLIPFTTNHTANANPVTDFGTFLLDPISKALGSYYRAISRRGPERSELLPRVVLQDKDESERYLRLILTRYVKPLGYLHILLSRNALEPLHVVEQWKEQVASLVRGPGEEDLVIGELGRLRIIHPNDFEFDYHQDLVTKLSGSANRKSRLHINKVITHLLLQKALAYINSDAKLDRLVVQINKGVEYTMLLNGIPLYLGRRHEFVGTWSGGRTVKEAVYIFDRATLLAMEELIMARVLTFWLDSVRRQPFFQLAPWRMVLFKFYPNEIAVVRRLQFYERLFGGTHLPIDGGSNSVGFYLGLDQVPFALSLLRPQTHAPR
ncbi:MAG: hypothetical protein AB7G93_10875 [Bdellovibrionales bacterium]